jgi:hypothetical protein
MIFVREAGPEDIEAIRIVNEQAFGQFRLRIFCKYALSVQIRETRKTTERLSAQIDLIPREKR